MNTAPRIGREAPRPFSRISTVQISNHYSFIEYSWFKANAYMGTVAADLRVTEISGPFIDPNFHHVIE